MSSSRGTLESPSLLEAAEGTLLTVSRLGGMERASGCIGWIDRVVAKGLRVQHRQWSPLTSLAVE
jgi:hypothetical protein